MTDIGTIADYISKQYHLRYGADIDEMKMHKLLYLGQREALVKLGRTLFNAPIYAYQYGPVIKSIREAYRTGSYKDAGFATINDSDDRAIVDYILGAYGRKTSWSLSRLTHCEYSWRHARTNETQGGGDRLIAIDDIRVDADRIRERARLRASLGVR